MDNKNEKSFYDIFSDSISDKGKESESSFSDIFHQIDDISESNDTNLNDEKSFDDVFLNSLINDENTDFDLENSNNPFFEEENIDSHDDIDKTVEEKDDMGSNPFFGEENIDSHDDIDKAVEEKDDMGSNPFFEEENVDSHDDIDKVVEEKDDIVTDDFSNLNSPFFDSEDSNKEEDVNPLLLNSLNLIEDENNTKNTTVTGLDQVKHFNVKVVKKKEPLFKMILGVISYAIFIWLLLIGIVLLIYVLDIKIRAAKGDYSKPTYNAYVVLTGSMLPGIQVGDVVVTKKVDAATLQEKDIITFASADTRFLNTIITHRIIKKNYDAENKTYSFQTKGDNNNVADSALVPEANIFGKVILKIPKLGYLQEFLASDGGWIIVILIPCLAVISYDIVKLAKGLKRKKYKNIKIQK